MKKKFILLFIGICTLALGAFGVSCGKSDNAGGGTQTSEEMEMPSPEFLEKRVEMIFGESKALSLVGLFDGETVSYKSNDESIVTVTADGVVQSVGVGTTVVKATTSEGRSALVQIVVHDPEFYPVPYITAAQDTITLSEGDSFTVDLACYYLTQKLDVSITAVSGNSEIVRADGNVITAVGAGETDVVFSAETAYGVAQKTVKVSVLERKTEFYLSTIGKEIYAGKPLDLVLYVNNDGELQALDGVSFSVADNEIASVEGNVLTPIRGGDTIVISEFEYEGESHVESLAIHVYGYHNCSFEYIDGTVDHVVEGLYGDVIALQYENADGNPEYNKAVQQVFVDGEEYTGKYITMPDRDVTVSVRFVNETKDDFTASTTDGHLLCEGSGIIQYESTPYTDFNGVSSDLNGHVKYSTAWASFNYRFDEVVTVNDFASVKVKMFVPTDLCLVYIGVATDVKFEEQESSTLRYETGNIAHKDGKVPFAEITLGEWVVIEMPLTAFVRSGEKMSGISFAISNSYIYIDWIAVNYGLSATDVSYQSSMLYKEISALENGSEAQMKMIMSFRNWANGLSAEDKQSEIYQANVAKVNAIIDAYYQEAKEMCYASRHYLKALDGTAATYNGEYASNNKKYDSRTYEHYYKSTISGAPHDITLSFDAFKFSDYEETSFGFYVIMANISDSPWVKAYATISVNGVACQEFDSEVAYYYKAVVKDGKFTLYSDEKGQASAKVILETALSSDVLSGRAALTIDVNFETYAIVETTEWYATMRLNQIS